MRNWLCCALAALWLCACTTTELGPGDWATGTIVPPSDERPQDDPVQQGKFHYAKGSYGLAERSFRTAVEANPQSAEAWLGLAASYDRLRRFDLANRAYKKVLAIQGRTVEVLNNLAYHHMLKGNLREARLLLDEAMQMDNKNPIVVGNLRLLDTWKTGDAEFGGAH